METLKELEKLVDQKSGKQIKEELTTNFKVIKTGLFQFEIDAKNAGAPENRAALQSKFEREATPGAKGMLFRSFALVDNMLRNQKNSSSYRESSCTKVVTQGDSWFAFPFVEPTDVSESLASKMPVFTLGCPGDDVTDMSTGQKMLDLVSAVKNTKAEIVALSGGGNELIGDDFPSVLTTGGQPKNAADFILADRLQEKIAVVIGGFERIINELIAVDPNLQICAHSYDYPLPRQQKATFLGPVLSDLEIPDKFWIGICAHIIDRFDEALICLAQKYERNFFRVDLRGIAKDLSSNWADEIHLGSETAMLAADEFIVQFENRLGSKFKLRSE